MTSEHAGSDRDRRKPDPVREARCNLCGETFLPPEGDDLMHFQRRDGELCGGEGALFRPFVIRSRNR